MTAGAWLGIGCRSGLAADLLARLAADMLAGHHVPPAALSGLASIDRRAAEPGLLALAAAWNRPIRFFSAERLEHETPRLRHPSPAVFAITGCHGVAEAAALAAAGPEAELLIAKTGAAGLATFALAGSRVALGNGRCDAGGSDGNGGTR